jgi:raffinose/stachyose/melibiose transport system substrate-binding protein
MKRKTSGFIFSFLLSISIALTGCGGSSSSEAGEGGSGSTSAEHTIELKVTGYKSGSELGAIPELNEKFMKENPGIIVTYEGMPGNQFKDFIKTRFVAGDASDVIMLHPGLTETIPYGEAGYLLDLSSEPWIERFSPSSLNMVRSGSAVYGIPNDMAVLGVYYNKKIFDQLQLSFPTNWDEFVKACEVIKQAGITPIAIGNNDGWMTLAALFTMAPSTVYKENPDFDEQLNKGQATFAEYWKEMVERWFSLEEKGYLTPNSTGVNLSQAQAAFASEQAAMYIDGNWSLPAILEANPDIEISMAPMPANDPGQPAVASAAVGTVWTINSKSEQIDAAKKYLEFWSQEENQKIWAKSQQSFVTLAGVSSDVAPELAEYSEALANGESYQFLDQGWLHGNAITAELMSSAQGVYLQAITVEEMLENMDRARADAAN